MIRPARRDDRPALASLQSHLAAPSPALLDAVPAVGICLVAVDEADQPVGYLLAVDGEDTHLAELVVHPAHRREGHGRALLSALLGGLESGTRVSLAVAVDNDPARALYESAGFVPVGYRSGFYASDGDAGGESGDDAGGAVDCDADTASGGERSDADGRSSDAVIYACEV